MIKIFLTVRNRLCLTKKCIEAIERHTKSNYELYVFNNLTDYLIDEHFEFFRGMYKENRLSQIVFNTSKSTFNAFSKAVANNQFGKMHELDPNIDRTDFIIMLDNDIILTPNWDQHILNAWKDVDKLRMNNIKVVTQTPAGIMRREKIRNKIAGFDAEVGYNGGSAIWTVRKNFFQDVGYLNLRSLVGINKKHDQHYWPMMNRKTRGKPYILGIDTPLAYDSSALLGSVCNSLEKARKNKKQRLDISFANKEKEIDNMNFDDFFKLEKLRRY